MKFKKIFALLIILLVSGCNAECVTNKNIDINIDTIMMKKIKYSNHDAVGYQYYLPNGVNVKEVTDRNQILYSKGNSYYLYADIVNYYYNVNKKYKKNKNAYISKKLNYRNKTGYLEVNKDHGKYYVEMMYNYAKIESYVKKEDLNDTIINMSYILSSITYNKNIIETMLGEQKYNLSNDETYNIFETKKTSSENNFLDYVNEYDNYDGEVQNLMDKEEVKTNKDE